MEDSEFKSLDLLYEEFPVYLNLEDKHKYIKIPCMQCEKEFLKRIAEYKRTKKHFCSLRCMGDFKVVHIRNELCLGCGKKLINKGDNRLKFCSHSCSAVYTNKKIKDDPILYAKFISDRSRIMKDVIVH